MDLMGKLDGIMWEFDWFCVILMCKVIDVDGEKNVFSRTCCSGLPGEFLGISERAGCCELGR